MSSPAEPPRKRASVRRFREMKQEGEKIVALTAYDALFAGLLDEAGVDLILVGDSLGQVVLGYESTVPVTVDEMIHHAKAVRRGAPRTFVVVDLPFMTYQASTQQALENGGRVLKEAGAEAVKLEGGGDGTCASVAKMVEAGIPVMGHLGLTPQSVNAIGGYRVQGRSEAEAQRLLSEAKGLQDAGCFALVLELIPAELARAVTDSLQIPTIGIGAGAGCDGQILVTHDVLGLTPGFQPRFLKRFAELGDDARAGIQAYAREVRAGTYPGPEHSFHDDP